MRLDRVLFAAAGFAALMAGAAQAADAGQVGPADPSPASQKSREAGQNVEEVVVTAKRLDAARDTIEPGLGASTYSLPSQFVDNLPGGTNNQLNQVILQAPGATQDSFGQLHIRGDHANLQYRLNNVILPEGLAVFGQTLSPRLAKNVELITGALPAQYGLRTAGIVNISTNTGFQNGGEVSLYGGSHGEIEPSFEIGRPPRRMRSASLAAASAASRASSALRAASASRSRRCRSRSSSLAMRRSSSRSSRTRAASMRACWRAANSGSFAGSF